MERQYSKIGNVQLFEKDNKELDVGIINKNTEKVTWLATFKYPLHAYEFFYSLVQADYENSIKDMHDDFTNKNNGVLSEENNYDD